MAVVAPHGYKYKPVILGRGEGTREGAMMQHRLPSNLSPKAKRLLLTADSRQPVRALVQVAPSADVGEIEQRIGAIGGTTQSLMRDTRLLSLDVPAGQLGELAGIDGVVYVEAGEAYGT